MNQLPLWRLLQAGQRCRAHWGCRWRGSSRRSPAATGTPCNTWSQKLLNPSSKFKKVIVDKAPQLDEVCELNRGCLQCQLSISGHLDCLTSEILQNTWVWLTSKRVAELWPIVPGKFGCLGQCPASPAGALSSPSSCPPCEISTSPTIQLVLV